MMMSRNKWMSVVTALNMLPLFAANYANSAVGGDSAALTVSPTAETRAATEITPALSPGQIKPTETTPPAAVVAVKPAADTSPQNDGPYDLNMAELSRSVWSPKIVPILKDNDQPQNDKSNPMVGVTIQGSIYKECADHFSLTNSIETPEDTAKGQIGFVLTDDGQGAACVKTLRDAKKRCTIGNASRPGTCVPLSVHFSESSTHIDLTGYAKDVKIGLLFSKDGAESLQFADAQPEPIAFESAATLKKKADDAAQAAIDARNERNEDRFKNCRADLDQLSVARKALRELIKDTRMALEERRRREKELTDVETKLIQKQKEAALAKLVKKAKNIKSTDDALEVSDELAQFASDNPELAKGVIKAQEALKDQVLRLDNIGPQNFAAAKQILGNLAGMDDVSAAQAQTYRMQMRGMDIGGLVYSIQNAGSFDYFSYSTFLNQYTDYTRSAYQDLMTTCRSSKSAGGSIGSNTSAACQMAQTNYTEIARVPSFIQQTQRDQYMRDMDQQRMINQSLGMAYGGATGGATAPMSGAQGPFSGTSPMGAMATNAAGLRPNVPYLPMTGGAAGGMPGTMMAGTMTPGMSSGMTSGMMPWTMGH